MEGIITRYGYIYKVTNKINQKVYIGKKVGNSFDKNYWGTGIKLRNAIKEFGLDNFEKEVIEWCSTKDVLKERERYWIEQYNSRNPDNGYNTKKGPETDISVLPECVIMSVQIPKEIYINLKNMAKNECTSVSYIVRKAIIKTVREDNI